MKKCTKCGTENKDSAKFCIKCGAPFADAAAADKNPQKDSHKAEGHEEKTETTGATEAAPSSGSAPDPSESAKKGMPGFLQGKNGKRIAIIAAVAVVAVIAVVSILTGQGPSDSLIKSDFASTDFSSVAKPDDTYETGGNYEVSSFKIVKKAKDDSSTNFFKTEMWDVVVDATLSNGSADIQSTWHVTYYKNGNSWNLFTSYINDSVTYSPKSGVDEDKVLANAEKVFNGGYSYSSSSSSDSDATYQIKDHTTNGTTDTLTLEKVEDGKFATTTTDATCTFVFDEGHWSEGSAEKGQPSTDYSKLVGTWQGTFVTDSIYSMQYILHGDTGACNGGSANPIVLKIDSADASTGKISGTVSVLEHKHAVPEGTVDSSDGDTMADIPFSTTIASTSYGVRGIEISSGSSSNYDRVAISIYPDSGTQPTPTLDATVKCEQPYTSKMGMTSSDFYTDTYTLVKAE